MRTIILAAAIGCAVVALGCGGSTPTAPTAATATAATAPAADQTVTTSSALAHGAGMQKEAISGTTNITGITPPAREVLTSSDMCHAFHFFEYTTIEGDLEGTITYDASAHRTCDYSHLVASGPFTGEITFHGRTGTVAGQWTTNCKFDTALGSPSCDGTLTFRGAGELDGYQFHYVWGPGWWPFHYTGTAFWR